MSGEGHRKAETPPIDMGEHSNRKSGKKKENSARALFLGENDLKSKTKPADVGQCRKPSSKPQSSSLRFSGERWASVKRFSYVWPSNHKQKNFFSCFVTSHRAEKCVDLQYLTLWIFVSDVSNSNLVRLSKSALGKSAPSLYSHNMVNIVYKTKLL
jgi:hypothetical protein